MDKMKHARKELNLFLKSPEKNGAPGVGNTRAINRFVREGNESGSGQLEFDTLRDTHGLVRH